MKNAFPAVLTAVSAFFVGSLAHGGVVDLPRYPAISPEGSVVVFSWRGDLWKAPISGGAAVRLTSHPANEGRSAFSPDGAQIVFESDREGGRNLFIMNSDGSGLRQLTHGDSSLTLSGTGVDGSGRPVAFVEGARENDLYRGARPYFVPLTGGTIERVHAAFGSHPVSNATGSTVLFERGGSDWARRAYQGPDNRNVWAWNRDGNSFTQLTDHPGNDGYAWFAGNDMVYLSDRGNGRSANVWRKPLTGTRGEGGRQLTNFDDDVRELVVSADGKTAAFVVWDSLYRLDLSDPNAQPVKVTVTGSEDSQDLTRTRNMGREVTEAQLSPDGKTMAFVAYGDVYVKGVDERSPFVRVTSNPWRERDIAWMPDGTKLLFVSDEDGNDSIYEATVELTRGELRKAFKDKLQPKKEEPAAPEPAAAEPAAPAAPATPEATEEKTDEKQEENKDDKKEDKKEDKKDEGARWADAMRVTVKPLIATPASERSPSPSPDGKQLAYRKELNAMVVRDLTTGEERVIRDGFDMGIDWRWSPDGKYFAIEQSDDNFNSDIWVVPTDGSAPAVNVSRHPDGDGNPRWSADSKVLAFVSSRLNNESDVYLVFLDKDLEGMSRFEQDQYFKDAADAAKKRAADRLPSSKKKEPKKEESGDPTKPDAAKPDAAKPDAAKSDAPKPEPAKPLDLDDAYLRLRRLTSMPGNEMGLELTPAGDRVYFTAQDQGGGLFSMAWSGGESKKLSATGSIQQMTADGSKLVLASKTAGSVVNLPGGDAKSVEFTDTLETDLAAQSRQKFLEAARIMAYQFYSPTMNGVDWPAATAKWAQLASAARTDEEFDYVANRFLGELNASHLGVRSPREGGVVRLGTGRLAAKTRPVEGGVEVFEILKDSPLLKSVTPLAVGDVITRVNGRSITATVTLDELLRNTVGKETVVAVKRTAASGESIELEAIVVPVSAGEQSRLAYEATQVRSRDLVSKLSNGRIGYIHVQSMDQPSLDDYERDLYAAAEGKDGLIIDVRNNGGGWTADRLLSSIMASPHAYTIPRGGNPARKGRYPADRLFIQRYTLPINMLANEKSFSNAEITAHAFKTLKRGTLVGQQTYGGVISTGSASLIDGTTVRTPFRGWYLPDGTDMEKNGAIPDVVVPQTPEDEGANRDAQLEIAVTDLMKRLN
jgi:tricorn protease